MHPERPHILVIDDDNRLRELLRKYLAENGFRVTTASDAVDARAKIASLTFDLLVLDVMMPGESGLALTESLRERSAVPILMLTAMGESEDRIAGLERGVDRLPAQTLRTARTRASHSDHSAPRPTAIRAAVDGRAGHIPVRPDAR